MRTHLRIAMVLLGLSSGCEALEPTWSSHVDATPLLTCASVCESEGELCMRNQCAGNTIAVDEDLDGIDDAYVPGDCDEELTDVIAPTDYVACCCTSAGS